jgi:acetolactate synthase-1/2/3 large subunit
MSMSENQGATTTVGAALAEGLARAGVKIVFTVPGESVLGLLDGLAANHVRVVAARHEGSAAFMAAAVGQLTGRPAVCIGTGGPGAANLAIGLHAARGDSAPVIAIVGVVRRDVKGHEAYQELDVVRAFEPIVKWAAEVKDAAGAVALMERAVATAMKGRPGPVLLAVPADVLEENVPVSGSDRSPVGRPEHYPDPNPAMVRKVIHLLADAHRPLILAGAGILRARSTDALVKFAQMMRVPVVSSWRRGDVFPNDNPLYLGMAGLSAPDSVRARLEEADALLVLGCRLGETTTYGYQIPGPTTRWAQIDVEPRGAASAHRPDIVMVADVAAFLRMAQRVLARAAFDAASLDERTAQNAADRAAYEAGSVVDSEPWDGPGVHPGRVVATLTRVLPPDAILTIDAGDFGTWAARGYRFTRPGTFLGSSDGPMGYGLPAAIGASLARPGRLVVALAGDGGFAMTMADLETAVRERAHVVAIVFDNGRYGAMWRRQEERGSDAGPGTRLGAVDFAAVAEACGALGISVHSDEEFEAALRQALEASRPALLHLALDPRWTEPGVSPLAPRERRISSPEPEAVSEATDVEPSLAEVGPDAMLSAAAAVWDVGEPAAAVGDPGEADAEAEALTEAATEPIAEAVAEPIAEPVAEPEVAPEPPPADDELEVGQTSFGPDAAE